MSINDDKEAKQQHTDAERRAFLKQLGIISAAGIAAGYGALAPPHWPLSINDPDGERGKPEEETFLLPEGGYTVEASSVLPLLGVARGEDIDAGLRAAIDAIGGITRFIKKDDVVLIKPNVAFERAAVLGATTNPDLLKSLIYMVREAGAKEIRVCDNPIESPESCFMRSGIRPGGD